MEDKREKEENIGNGVRGFTGCGFCDGGEVEGSRIPLGRGDSGGYAC